MVCTARSLLATSLLVAAVATSCASGPQPAWEEGDDGSLTLRRGDEVVWTFHSGDARGKPCFHPLALPGGRVLTVDQPDDHPWHHGLWFSWKYIDRVNYWENVGATGRPAGRTNWEVVDLETRDDGSARIELALDYTPPDGPTVLTEQRVVETSAPKADGSFWIDWDATFTARADCELDRTPLPGEPGGQPFGGYAGLSLRMRQLDAREARTADGPVEWNRANRFRGESIAFDYSGRLEGDAVGVAIFDHPDNLRAPTSWYAIRSSNMTFFTPAVICRGPYAMAAGDTLRLRYRVLVHPGRLGSEELAAAAADFARADP